MVQDVFQYNCRNLIIVLNSGLDKDALLSIQFWCGVRIRGNIPTKLFILLETSALTPSSWGLPSQLKPLQCLIDMLEMRPDLVHMDIVKVWLLFMSCHDQFFKLNSLSTLV